MTPTKVCTACLCIPHTTRLPRAPGVGPGTEKGTDCRYMSHGGSDLSLTDDGLIVLHVVRKVDTNATDMVIYDPVDEDRDVGHEFTDPFRVGTLGNGPLKDV